MRIPVAQVKQLASEAGFAGDDLIIATAIAGSESGYDPECGIDIAGVDEGQSIGLWQIYQPAHPEFDGYNLTDPAMNAKAAFSIYSVAGSKFTPWSSYNNGKYTAFMPIATRA